MSGAPSAPAASSLTGLCSPPRFLSLISRSSRCPCHLTPMGECCPSFLNRTSGPLLICFSPTIYGFSPFMVRRPGSKAQERRELTQDEWHSKNGYKEDIHSGFCSSALQKGNYTVSHQTYPAFCPPPKQRRSSSNSSPGGGGISPPTCCLTRPSATTGAVLSHSGPD